MTPMDELFQIRSHLISIYKKYERFIIPVTRFIVILTILKMINNTVGYAKPLTKMTTILVLALVGTLSPIRLIIFSLILLVSLHIGVSSLEIGIIVFVTLFLIYLLFVRLYPKESLFIIGILVAYNLRIPYIIPLFAGLFSSTVAIVSVIIGTMMWYVIPQLITMMQANISDLSSIGEVLTANISTLQELVKTDHTMISSMIILSIVLLTVYLIRNQSIDYSEYIAILVGSIMNIVGFIFAVLLLKIDIRIGGLIISTTISAAITMIAQFFSKAVDYSRAETVRFEDEENYYYVKVVPKIIVNKSQKQVRQIYSTDEVKYESHKS